MARCRKPALAAAPPIVAESGQRRSWREGRREKKEEVWKYFKSLICVNHHWLKDVEVESKDNIGNSPQILGSVFNANSK